MAPCEAFIINKSSEDKTINHLLTHPLESKNQGFLLSSTLKQSYTGTFVELWLSTAAGPVCLRSDIQQELFFVREIDWPQAELELEREGIQFKVKTLDLKTFQHEKVIGLYFSARKHRFDAKRLLETVGVASFEDDIRLQDRFLMERFVYGSMHFSGQESPGHKAAIFNKKPKNDYIFIEKARITPSNYVPSLTTLSIDIECSQSGELYSIGLAAAHYNFVIMLGQYEQDAPAWIQWVNDEMTLLKAFVEAVNQFDPDVIVGWNLINFDFRVLVERAKQLKVRLKLGRNGAPVAWREAQGDSSLSFVSIDGRVVIDGIDALKAATYQFESFSLQTVSEHLLGESKLVESTENKLVEIEHNFEHNKIALARYNLKDCQLVLDIFNKTQVLQYLVLRSQLTGLPLDRIGGSVAAFINVYLPKLHRAGYISPNRPEGGGLASPGGYVMDSKPGLYKNVLVFDFKSLYPAIIRTFKIDPLGLIEGLASPEGSIPGFKGAKFSREKHFLPDIIASLWQQRDEAKLINDSARSQAIKILMNSFYGVLGSGGCPFYDTRLASSITLRGHEIMLQTKEWIEGEGHQVIYGDTDSIFVWLDNETQKQDVAAIGLAIEQLINTKWKAKLSAELDLESFLEMQFETHFSIFHMPTIRGSSAGSKKRYAGMAEREGGRELIFKGLEAVRSDWTPLAREFQRELYRRIFEGEVVESYVQECVRNIYRSKLDDKLVYRKRVRRKLDHYVKNVPPHVKAARIAEKQKALEDNAVPQNMSWIEYVITVNGPEPLAYTSSKLDYEHYVEKQIQPIAEAILPSIGVSYIQLIQKQMALFTA